MCGVLGREQHLCRWPTHCAPINYLSELLGGQEAMAAALTAVDAGHGFQKRLRIRSPVLLRRMGVAPGASVYHGVSISGLKDGTSKEQIYIVAQMDVTEAVLAEKRVHTLQSQQRKLLQQILPQEVISVLLDRGRAPEATAVDTAATHVPGSHAEPDDEPLQQSNGVGHDDPQGNALSRMGKDSSQGVMMLAGGDDTAAVGARPLAPARSTSSMSDASELQLSTGDVQRLATFHPVVSILFTDIEGFTSMSQELHPAQVMLFLNHLFSQFDDLLEVHDVYKVETIGDCYMVCAGLFQRGSPSDAPMLESLQKSSGEGQATPDSPKSSTDDSCTDILGGHDPEHGPKLLRFAKAMMSVASTVITPLGQPVRMRVGLHTGSIMTGVVGRKMPRFCCFGDTVNTASRMESTGRPGYIHASAAFRDQTPDEAWVATGGVEVKGKGHMDTYLLEHTPAWSGLPEE